MNIYYDIVASICNESCRTDSYLISGGHESFEDALNYVNKKGIFEVDYCKYCKDDETAYIEIERHNEDGSISDVVTVD